MFCKLYAIGRLLIWRLAVGEMKKVMHSFLAICSRYFPRSLQQPLKAARSPHRNPQVKN
jgi:hypothetical protein